MQREGYQQRTPAFKRNAGAPGQFSVFREAAQSRKNQQAKSGLRLPAF